MIFGFDGIYQAAKNSFDMLRGALGVKVSHEVLIALTEHENRLHAAWVANNKLMGEYRDALETIGKLESELREIKNRQAEMDQFATEKNQYVSRQVGPGAFAYIKHPSGEAKDGEVQDERWFCCQCFDQQRKSTLQYAGSEAGDGLFKCSRCGDTVRIKTEGYGVTVSPVEIKRRLL